MMPQNNLKVSLCSIIVDANLDSGTPLVLATSLLIYSFLFTLKSVFTAFEAYDAFFISVT